MGCDSWNTVADNADPGANANADPDAITNAFTDTDTDAITNAIADTDTDIVANAIADAIADAITNAIADAAGMYCRAKTGTGQLRMSWNRILYARCEVPINVGFSWSIATLLLSSILMI